GGASGALGGLIGAAFSDGAADAARAGLLDGAVGGAVGGVGGVVVKARHAAVAARALQDAAKLGIGTRAVVAEGLTDLAQGAWPAVLVEGKVYVARFHAEAWRLAGRGPVQKYGMVVLDAAGRVLGWK
ncbi:MAG: hypothetical protein GXP27_15210, partial [Planctomycetes bacterium]|nr:hypothetical protein [Planctomycetota bacterium]